MVVKIIVAWRVELTLLFTVHAAFEETCFTTVYLYTRSYICKQSILYYRIFVRAVRVVFPCLKG
jgi:hypothetical protein